MLKKPWTCHVHIMLNLNMLLAFFVVFFHFFNITWWFTEGAVSVAWSHSSESSQQTRFGSHGGIGPNVQYCRRRLQRGPKRQPRDPTTDSHTMMPCQRLGVLLWNKQPCWGRSSVDILRSGTSKRSCNGLVCPSISGALPAGMFFCRTKSNLLMMVTFSNHFPIYESLIY